ncbi:glutamine-hydrolyzing GMP synthase [Myxococcota bacterium]|nr:glutamine-hydrolyzing GMP synthase [Myxococcota bacterium]MBU1380501.1 glutamine-hydrolyzing GMP synthase [Myxococcota bacterium]MBU1497273.1 glutamine-hydrolyzing GMP synthase [Myxococcota bacterium]
MKNSEIIAVMDLGGQYAHLIAAKLRSLGYYSEICDPEDDITEEYAGIILSGSPALSSSDEDEGPLFQLLERNVPILGFCFGHQEIAKHYGGRVIHGLEEFGPAVLRIKGKSPIFHGIPEESIVFMSHGDTVVEISDEFSEIGESYYGNSPVHRFAAIAWEEKKRYGFQFHPEVDDSIFGEKMLDNFASLICNLKPEWKTENYFPRKINDIRQKTGDKSVFALVSGGVDSTVLGKLLIEALGPGKVHMLHVDTGFMRKFESESVCKYFSQEAGKNFHFRDATIEFTEALVSIVNPEEKRRIIGELFVKICQEEMENLNVKDALLAQGTIYPDTVESGGPKRARVIKTHHNRVPMMEEMIKSGLVIEPLADLYKKEVRELGVFMGIPEDMVYRHPFPGPGLAVRLLASEGKVDCENMVLIEEQLNSLLEDGEAICPGILSVGVKGDLRSFEYAVLLKNVTDEKKLKSKVPEFVKRVRQINRIVINKGRDFKTVRVREAKMISRRIESLREVDYLVQSTLDEMNLTGNVWQFPVALAGVTVDGKDTELVILRPVMTVRAMTATVPDLPEVFYSTVRDKISILDPDFIICLDLTTKPPGTIEWE